MTPPHPPLHVIQAPTCGEGPDWERGATDGEMATVDSTDALFKGFADPTRLRILNILAAGELCVCDIVEILGVAQPTISRHLAYLRRTGLVTSSREGKFAHYQLAPARDVVHQTLIQCVAGCFRGVRSLDAERASALTRVAERQTLACP